MSRYNIIKKNKCLKCNNDSIINNLYLCVHNYGGDKLDEEFGAKFNNCHLCTDKAKSKGFDEISDILTTIVLFI